MTDTEWLAATALAAQAVLEELDADTCDSCSAAAPLLPWSGMFGTAMLCDECYGGRHADEHACDNMSMGEMYAARTRGPL